MYTWDNDEDFDENIETIKIMIKTDFTVTDIECDKLLKSVDRITPSIVENYSSISISGDGPNKIINNNNNKQTKPYEIKYKIKTNYSQYLFFGTSTLLVALSALRYYY